MACARNNTLIKNELIRYISSLGIDVKTITKARGNKGFFKEGRIDISKNLDDESAIKTIVHEFAHYINHKLDKSLKNLDIMFGNNSNELIDELLSVTAFVDKNALCEKLTKERDELKTEIKQLTETIKTTYPNFSPTENLKDFHKYAKFSNLNYLEKYDRVKIHNTFNEKLYTIKDVKKDFPDIPDVFVSYLNLKSKQRKRAKISSRINKLNKYYNEPCELFARFIEGIYLDIEKVKALAPNAFNRFMELHNKNHYKGLRELFSIVRIII